MLVSEHRRVVDHDDRAQIRKLIGEGKNLVDIFLIFGDEYAGATVAHLILDFRRRCCRVDPVNDGTERLRC